MYLKKEENIAHYTKSLKNIRIQTTYKKNNINQTYSCFFLIYIYIYIYIYKFQRINDTYKILQNNDIFSRNAWIYDYFKYYI